MTKKIEKDEFLKKANEKFNNKYKYGDYINFRTKMTIICPIHGEIKMSPQSHLSSKTGCRLCGAELKIIPEDEFLKKANKKFNNKFKYGKYTKFCSKIEIECPIHGKFLDTPQHHLYTKAGCPKCGKIEMGKTQSLGIEEFIKRANEIHEDKYDYLKFVYTTNKMKSIIICPIHGEFLQRPDHHLQGQGCPKCKTERNHTKEVIQKQNETKRKNKTFNKSKPEDDIYKYLIEEFSSDDVIRNYDRDKRYPFSCDFYIKSLDLFIECNFHWTHGGHWFDNNNKADIDKLNAWQLKDTKFYDNAINTWTIRDINKRKVAKDNKLNYLVLWNPEDFNICNIYKHQDYEYEYLWVHNFRIPIYQYLKSHNIKFTYINNCFILKDYNFAIQIGQIDNNIENINKNKSNNIETLTIFPWNNYRKIIEYIEYKLNIRQVKKLFARKLTTYYSNSLTTEMRNFIDKYHILGKVNHSKFVGASYFKDNNNEIIGLATFIKDSNNNVELKRLIFKNGISIIGGASKLIKDFAKQYNIHTIYTYSDRNISEGIVYESIGFKKLKIDRPQKIYYNLNNNHKFSEASLWRIGADRLLKNKVEGYKEYGIGKNLPGNEEIVLSNGYIIYKDCGNYYWKLEI